MNAATHRSIFHRLADRWRSATGRSGRHRSKNEIDPNQPHRFRPLDELSLMAATDQLSSLGGRGSTAVITIATGAENESRCRLRECGKGMQDPIHI